MLGDTAVAVNPSDERYRHLVGRTRPRSRSPTGRSRSSPTSAVDASFGTGMVKVTPAHDPNDFLIGQRYNENADAGHRMAPIPIFDTSARTNDAVPEKYRSLDRFVARKAVVADLETGGFLVKIEPYTHNVGRCYRCDTVIEPYLSDQWFVRMKPLAEKALAVVQDGNIRFYPDRWVKVYEHWMTNIRDWCISRQLWWGHRVPVWYCVGDDACTLECREPIVAPQRARGVPALRLGEPPAGRRRARHLVLVVALAVLDARLAATIRRGPAVLLSHGHARHRAGHHLLLGRAHDHGRTRGDRRRPGPRRIAADDERRPRPLPRCLLHEHHPRRPGQEDEQVARELPRPAGSDQGVRGGRPPLHDRLSRAARTGRAVFEREVRDGPQLREQDLERRTVPPA